MTSSIQRHALTLQADAAFCLACGLPGLLAPDWLARFLLPGTPSPFGFPMATVMLELGLALAAYALVLFVVSRKAPAHRGLLTVFTLADGAWVLGTVLLLGLFGASFSGWGMLALLAVALDTALLGFLKLRLLRGAAPAALAI